tara:strand:- start:12551 stop:13237 length:687 start_codon:yes stop_codon:yes gene_type:complete
MRKKILKKIIGRFISPHVKSSFLGSGLIKDNAKILDVGCGNKSVIEIKSILPNSIYTGIDITDLNQNRVSKSLMQEYIISEPDSFSETIKGLGPKFDLVISAHNMEHCDDPEEVVVNILSCIKEGGFLYMSFPSKKSVNFPSREGTLNFYDDDTHNNEPPDFDKILNTIKDSKFEIIYQSKEYKPFFGYLIGFFLEPFSVLKKKVLRGTWDYYGFQAIIQARKIDNNL